MMTRKSAYKIYTLKRLSFARARGEVDTEDFFQSCKRVLEQHAADNFLEPEVHRTALADADEALADVRVMMGDPNFDLSAAIARAEAELQKAQEPAAEAAPVSQPVVAAATAPTEVPTPPRSRLGLVAVIALLAGGLAGAVGGYVASSSGGVPVSPAVGEWRWGPNAVVELMKDGSFSFNKQPAGHFFATSGRHFILIHGNGRFVDYVTLEGEGTRLVGFSAAGAAINAVRVR